MCGRFGLIQPEQLAQSGVLEQLAVATVTDDVPDRLAARYNVAPSQPVFAVAQGTRQRTGQRTATMLRWGLIPAWAKDASIGHRLANARAETVATAPSFRGPWAKGRRAAVFADVFYEWADLTDADADPRNGDPGTTGVRPVAARGKSRRQPWALRLVDGAPFAFAALWERWRDPAAADAAPLATCTLITTASNALMSPIHERMPVLLTGDALAAWLDPATTPADATALLQPYAPERMERWPISTRVNTPRHDDAEVLAPTGDVVRIS